MNRSSNGKTDYQGAEQLYSYRTIPHLGLLMLNRRQAEWRPFLVDLLLAALAGVALAALLSFGVARSITRPIRRVARATRALAAGEAHEPLPTGRRRPSSRRSPRRSTGWRPTSTPRARPSATSCSRSATS